MPLIKVKNAPGKITFVSIHDSGKTTVEHDATLYPDTQKVRVALTHIAKLAHRLHFGDHGDQSFAECTAVDIKWKKGAVESVKVAGTVTVVSGTGDNTTSISASWKTKAICADDEVEGTSVGGAVILTAVSNLVKDLGFPVNDLSEVDDGSKPEFTK